MEYERKKANEILQILKGNFSIPNLSNIIGDPFRVLIRTVISQSTAETNTRRAYENLSNRLSITPRNLAEAAVQEIEDALKVAGLYRNKSRIIKDLSKAILEKYGGSLNFIFSLPLEEARERLMSLPGIGPKTADIVLLFCAKRPTLPVDTHTNRVSKRLGLVAADGRYEEVRKSLQTLYRPEDYFMVHMLLIAHGRKYCRALKPMCDTCPARDLCPSASTFLSSKNIPSGQKIFTRRFPFRSYPV